MLGWVSSTLLTIVGWGLAFWFVPFSWFLCSRPNETGAEEEGRDSPEPSRMSETEHHAGGKRHENRKHDHTSAKVLATTALLRRHRH